jgi:hypothetical protein
VPSSWGPIHPTTALAFALEASRGASPNGIKSGCRRVAGADAPSRGSNPAHRLLRCAQSTGNRPHEATEHPRPSEELQPSLIDRR